MSRDDMFDDDVRELLALAAVGALDPADEARLREHIADRPDLLAELARHEEAAATLADAVAAPPPPGLRADVLAAIADVPQAGPGVELTPPPPPTGATVVPIGAARRRRLAVVLGAAAAAVAAVVVGAAVLVGDDGGTGTDQVAAVVDAADAVEIPMAGTGAPGSLEGVTIVRSATEDAAVILAESVPEPEGDGVYALWAIRDGTPEHVADFVPDDDGRLAVYAEGLDPASADQWGITAEPAPDADAPTMPILNATGA